MCGVYDRLNENNKKNSLPPQLSAFTDNEKWLKGGCEKVFFHAPDNEYVVYVLSRACKLAFRADP